MRTLLEAQLPDLPGHLRAVLALWVEGTLLARNGCQDTVTLALPCRCGFWILATVRAPGRLGRDDPALGRSR